MESSVEHDPPPNFGADRLVARPGRSAGRSSSRRPVRRWLAWFVAVSLLVHLAALLAILLLPADPSASLDEGRAASPSQLAFELMPSIEDSMPSQPGPEKNEQLSETPPPPSPPIPSPPPVAPEPVPMPPPPEPPPPAPPAAPPPPEPPTPPAPSVIPPPKPPNAPVSPPPPRPRPTPAPRPAPTANPFTPYFLPPPPSSRQAQGRNGGAIDLSIGRVENYRAEPPRRSVGDEDLNIQVAGSPIGGDWMQALQVWWVEHRRYPQQAAENGEQGTVLLRFTVDRGGHVNGATIVSRSGSQWLDMQAIATFGNARLPPLPFNVVENQKTVTISIHYILTH